MGLNALNHLVCGLNELDQARVLLLCVLNQLVIIKKLEYLYDVQDSWIHLEVINFDVIIIFDLLDIFLTLLVAKLSQIIELLIQVIILTVCEGHSQVSLINIYSRHRLDFHKQLLLFYSLICIVGIGILISVVIIPSFTIAVIINGNWPIQRIKYLELTCEFPIKLSRLSRNLLILGNLLDHRFVEAGTIFNLTAANNAAAKLTAAELGAGCAHVAADHAA